MYLTGTDSDWHYVVGGDNGGWSRSLALYGDDMYIWGGDDYSMATAPPLEWFHWVGTWDSNNYHKGYLNGVKKLSGSGGRSGYNCHFLIGREYESSTDNTLAGKSMTSATTARSRRRSPSVSGSTSSALTKRSTVAHTMA